jgi:hypothetical protein
MILRNNLAQLSASEHSSASKQATGSILFPAGYCAVVGQNAKESLAQKAGQLI